MPHEFCCIQSTETASWSRARSTTRFKWFELGHVASRSRAYQTKETVLGGLIFVATDSWSREWEFSAALGLSRPGLGFLVFHTVHQINKYSLLSFGEQKKGQQKNNDAQGQCTGSESTKCRSTKQRTGQSGQRAWYLCRVFFALTLLSGITSLVIPGYGV